MSTLDNGVFCFACENAALKECNRLVTENAKLRDDLEDQEGYDQMLRDRLRQQTELCVKAETENAKLRDWCSELLHMAESNDPDFLHWPEIHDELRKLGVKIVKL